MTSTKHPAIVELMARAIYEERKPQCSWDEYLKKTPARQYRRQAQAALSVLPIDEMIACLHFYANEVNYLWTTKPVKEWLLECGADVMADNGQRARDVLAKLPINKGE